jgi:hypothetical protein
VSYKSLVKGENTSVVPSDQVSVIMPPPYVIYFKSLLVRSELPLLEKRRPESMAAFLYPNLL